MLWKICYHDRRETVAFAARELKRYLNLIDNTAEVVLMRTDKREDFKNAIWLHVDEKLGERFPQIKDTALDDAILIDINGSGGTIAGVNPRSVLIAVYRFLRELGYAWLYPGPGGEIIPERKLGGEKIYVCEAPSCRHRGLCIEGAVSFDHVKNVLDWLPKVGMNGYFNQFIVPFAFFDRWYRHTGNPKLESNPLTLGEISALVNELILEAKKRGLLYHVAGHGWTCEPFGIEGTSWERLDYRIPPESVEFLALVNGRRELSDGLPLNTNLCYSNPEVLECMTGAAADYCKAHPEVDYLHFWFADGQNNHCECENCKDTQPSDFYVQYLNRLDEKLTEAGLDTKIVFLIYVDLLWEPVKARINNPGRFVLMFAPITRTYASSYAESAADEIADLKPYTRNKLEMPRTVAENVARLKKWQEQFGGDSFIFDYHFMWDHFRDPGSTRISRVLFDDMKGLHALGLNGMVSCQLQRAFFPTGFGVSMMAIALWNGGLDFYEEAGRYFETAFGAQWRNVYAYLAKLSNLFDPAYLRHERPQVDTKAAGDFNAAKKLVKNFLPQIEAVISCESLDSGRHRSWELLRYHADYCLLLADAFSCKARGASADELEKKWRKIAEWATENEMALRDVLDVYYFLLTMENVVKGDDIVLF